MTVTHRCQFCDSDYVCDTMHEVSEDVYRCQCKSVDTCPGCSDNGACEKCEKAPATGDGHQPFYCEACEADWLDNYEPDDPDPDPVTLAEFSDRAYRDRAELRRRD